MLTTSGFAGAAAGSSVGVLDVVVQIYKTSAWENQTLVFMNFTCCIDPPCVADEFQSERLALLVAELTRKTLQYHSYTQQCQSGISEDRLQAAHGSWH